MYNLVVLMGESGAGKDSMMQAVLEKLAERGHMADIHEIVFYEQDRPDQIKYEFEEDDTNV